MSETPERISISPTYNQKLDDDYYLVDRKAFPGKGTEYIRADHVDALLKAEREKALREAAEECLMTCMTNDQEFADRILALIEKDQADG